MYTDDKNYIVMTVINSADIHNFMQVMKQHPETFVYFSDGVRVQGDFHYHSERYKQTKNNSVK
jgi:transcriptional regulator of NAD metabolism